MLGPHTSGQYAPRVLFHHVVAARLEPAESIPERVDRLPGRGRSTPGYYTKKHTTRVLARRTRQELCEGLSGSRWSFPRRNWPRWQACERHLLQKKQPVRVLGRGPRLAETRS